MVLLTDEERAAIENPARSMLYAIEVRDLADNLLGELGTGPFSGLAVKPDSVAVTRHWGQATSGELACTISASSDTLIDFDQVMLAPVVELEGTRYDFGRFLPFRPNRSYTTDTVSYEIRAPDRGLLLGMQFSRSGLLDLAGSDDAGNGFAAGSSIVAAIQRLGRMAGVARFAIPDPLAVLAADRAWAIGQVTLAQAIGELLASIAFRPLRFDRIGRLASERAERLETAQPVWTYREIEGLKITEQPENIANIAIILCEDPNRDAFGVRFVNDNPDSPDSTVNVPIRRVLNIKDSTIANVDEGLERARTALEERSRASRSATISVPPNPALDPLDVIEVEIGDHAGRWRVDEIAWTWGALMELKLSDASAAIASSGAAE